MRSKKAALVVVLAIAIAAIAVMAVCVTFLLKQPAAPVGNGGGQSVDEPSAIEVSSEGEKKLSDETVRMIGRFRDRGEGRFQFAWPGSTIEGGFRGTEIAVRLKIAKSPTANTEDYVQVIVDDGEPFVLKVESGVEEYMLASGLPDGVHRVTLVKRTETLVGILEFQGFSYLSGEAAFLPQGKSRRIEIYGDSISAGYGNDADGSVHTGFSAAQENAYMTYGMIAARNLEADCTLLAVSGMGMYQDLGGVVQPEDFFAKFGRTILSTSAAKWKFEPKPDAVIINLGTNDFASRVDPALYRRKYRHAIEEIRAVYPDAAILCCMGTISYGASASIQTVVDECVGQGDDRISFYAFEPIRPEDGIGVDGHPSGKTHQAMAEELTAVLREKLGW